MAKHKATVVHPSDQVVVALSMDQVDPPDDPARIRIDDQAVIELAQSIKQVGQLQEVKVVPRGKRYEIVFGHRRWLACKHLRKPTIQAIVVDWPEERIFAARVAENVDREGVSALEVAQQFAKMQEHYHYTNAQIAGLTGKSPSFVSEHLKIMKYPLELRTALAGAQITFSVARELARIQDAPTLRYYLHSAIETGVTPALARQWADEAISALERAGIAPAPFIPTQPMAEPAIDGRPCFLCANHTHFSHLSSVWLCHKCIEAIKQSVQQMADKP